ncbi:MAG: Gfo/Idh/MocA family protein [Alphaproteobacteria bacterium]
MTSALVVGYGSIGARHARILEELGCAVGVVSARNGVHARRFADLARAFDAFTPDYVVIANETTKHLPALAELERLGYDGPVLVEKPLGEPGQPPYGGKNGAIFVAYNLRFHPLVLELKRRIEGHRLISAEVRCGSHLPDWRSGRDYRETASAKKASGGGVLRDLSHELDFANWLFGPWKRLAAAGGRLGPLEIETEDVFALLVESDACPVLTVSLNYLERREERRIVVNTRKTTLCADLIAGTLHDGADAVFTIESFDIEDTYRKEHETILAGKPAGCCTLAEGERVRAMIAAAEKAARTGAWVSR